MIGSTNAKSNTKGLDRNVKSLSGLRVASAQNGVDDRGRKTAGARESEIIEVRIMFPQSQRKRLSLFVTVASIAVIGLASVSWVRAAGPQTPAASQTYAYVPSVSDLMLTTVQPRHVRLWRAGQSHNWEFAEYELGNLSGAFHRLGSAHPVQNDIPLEDLIGSVTPGPFADLKKAIEAKDTSAFDRAYLGLTAACNTCHEAVNHRAVRIKVPGVALSGPIDDLDLDPAGH